MLLERLYSIRELDNIGIVRNTAWKGTQMYGHVQLVDDTRLGWYLSCSYTNSYTHTLDSSYCLDKLDFSGAKKCERACECSRCVMCSASYCIYTNTQKKVIFLQEKH